MKQKNYQLIEKCKKGDLASKEWLYRTYAPTLLGICLRYIKDRMEAEDVLHEGFIIIYEKINQFEHKGSFEGWIKRIMVNKALNHLKKNNNLTDIEDIKEPVAENDEKPEATNAKELIAEADFSQTQILETIQSLPDGFRTVFNLYVFENYPHKEIADKLGISVGTSKSQLLRARKLIQKKLYDKIIDKKPKKKKKVITYAALLIMNDELIYIDNLAKSKLDGFSVNPLNTFSGSGLAQTGTSNSIVSNTMVSQVKSNLTSLLAKKVFWISTGIVGTSAVFLGIKTKPEPVTMEPIVVISDSIAIDDLEDELELIEVEEATQNIVYKREKVPVRKTITVRKPVIIRDTLTIKDTQP